MPRFDPHPKRRPAVVTGASSGIGRATVLALAGAGHPVAIGARRIELCEETADEVIRAGGEAIALPLDVQDAASVTAFAKAATDTLGPIEVVVSNAGDVRPVTVAGADPDEFARQLDVNLLGAQRILHAFAPEMVERRRGDIVLVTSEVAVRPRPRMAAYVASKAGLEQIGRAMQMELEGTGVRVGIVRPGPTATEQGSDWEPAEVEATMDAWRRWGVLRHHGYLRSGDVAAAIVAIVSTPRGTQLSLVEVQPEAPS